MALAFSKATKRQAKARIALFGPSGAGKTFSALRIANGLKGDGRIALIDTERGSASKYADRFDFDALDLPNFRLDTYIEAMKAAAGAGYSVLVIDSLSHAWQELLDEVDKIAKAKFRGNTWSAWSEGTPKQRQFVEALLAYPGHVLATMRSKTEWVEEKDHNGKTKPVRVGLSPQQGKGIEYEFDVLVELTTDHVATVIKDRSGKFQDRLMEKPGEEFGAEMLAWLSDGSAVLPPSPPPVKQPSREQILLRIAERCHSLEALAPGTSDEVYATSIGTTRSLDECSIDELIRYGIGLKAAIETAAMEKQA